MSGLHMIMNKNGVELQNMMNWFSLGMTSAAIFEHACTEINKKGVFDLEILPAIYSSVIHNLSTILVVGNSLKLLKYKLKN